MVGSTSSSSSCASFGSFDDVLVKPSPAASAGCTIKFLCSYGGKILPRHPDGKLRYVGGDTRVLSVDRSLPFAEVMGKMREMCGWDAVSVRCQLPTEDLDALVSVTSDEDMANLVEVFDTAAASGDRGLKIRAFLFPTSAQAKTPRSLSPPSTPPHAVTRSRSYHKHHQHQQQHHYVQAARASPTSAIRCVHRQENNNPYAHHQYYHQLQQNHHQYAQPLQPVGQARPQQFLVQHGSWD